METKPYGGYPQFYDVKITQLIEQVNPGGQVWNIRVGRKHRAPYGVFEGMTIFDAGAKVGQAAIGYIPTDQEWRFVNIYEDTATSMRALVESIDKTGFSRDEPWKMTGSSLPEHETFFFYLQRICNHCTYPDCLAACPRKAIYKRPEDGIVLIDQNRCRGYKKCVEQCPYKKPMYRGTTRVSEKCIACYPRIEAPRSKLRGITELKQSDLSEIFAGLPLPLHVPFDGLPVGPLSHRRHIVPVAPKFPAPQHPFHGRLSPKDLSRRETLSTTRGTGLPEGDATRFKTMTPTSIAPQSDNASR